MPLNGCKSVSTSQSRWKRTTWKDSLINPLEEVFLLIIAFENAKSKVAIDPIDELNWEHTISETFPTIFT